MTMQEYYIHHYVPEAIFENKKLYYYYCPHLHIKTLSKSNLGREYTWLTSLQSIT